jgi:hypothetical protein
MQKANLAVEKKPIRRGAGRTGLKFFNFSIAVNFFLHAKFQTRSRTPLG